MNELIKILTNFTRIEQKAWFSKISDKHLYQFLKEVPETDLNIIIEKWNQMDLDFEQDEIAKVKKATPKELEKIIASFKKIYHGIGLKQQLLEKNTIKVRKKDLQYREVLKADFKHFSKAITDQEAGVEYPPMQKILTEDITIIDLPPVDKKILQETDVFNCLFNRKSRRKYSEEPLKLEELSFLLWATQGVRMTSPNGKITARTVPSGGARNPFETYLAIHNVTGLQNGLYIYRPLEHKLVFLGVIEDLKEKVGKASLEQTFVGNCAVTFIWSVIPYRTEWRYTLDSKKIILQDSGHLCQNLYIACEAIGCGTCAIGAYDQKLFDQLLQLDGIDEFVVYVAPVGKISKKIKIIKLPEHVLQKYCGDYWCASSKLNRKIMLKEGKLCYWRAEDNYSFIEPTAKDQFIMDEGTAILNFTSIGDKWNFSFKTEDGNVLEFILQD